MMNLGHPEDAPRGVFYGLIGALVVWAVLTGILLLLIW
jgi:hypothetical protein